VVTHGRHEYQLALFDTAGFGLAHLPQALFRGVAGVLVLTDLSEPFSP
jgi:hypothetical protein